MAGASFKLIIEDDAGKQIVVPFTRDVITIGRKEGNTIRLTERNVSRNHAKLSKENGHVVVEDLKSFNGIKLNGDRIDGRVHVHEGDTIQIGDYHLALHAQDQGAAAGSASGVNATQPLRRDTAPQQPDDDEFAGDTQRWEPPAGGLQLSVPGLATQEDRALTEEHTIPQPAHHGGGPPPPPPLPPSHTQQGGGGGVFSTEKNGFGADSGDTERVSMDMLDQLGSKPSSPPVTPGSSHGSSPLPTRRPEPELEPTVRQVASPPPITMPPSPAVPSAAMPSPLSPAIAQGGSQPFPPSPMPPPAAAAMPPPQPAPPPQPQPAPPPPQQARPPTPSSPASPGQQVQQGPTIAPRTPKEEAKTVLEEQTEAMRASPGAEDVMYPRLVVLNTIFAGSTFSLRAAEAVMGRTEDNDITIEHKSVSRNHAKIVREGDRVRILDLKSANGVLVNNEECEAAVLKPGDVVELGRVKLRYVPIGERFTVSPDEIERARIADAAGDDFESDAGTGVTNPVRKKQGTSGPQPSAPYDLPNTGGGGGKNPVFLAVGGVLIILILIALVIVWKTLGGEKHVDNSNTNNNTVAVGHVDTPPDPVKLEPVAAVVDDSAKATPPTTPPDGEKPPVDAASTTGTGSPPPDDAAKAGPDAKVADASNGNGGSGNSGGSGSAKPSSEKDNDRPRTGRSTPKQDPSAALRSAKQKILAGKPEEAVSDLAPFVKGDNAEVHRTLGVAYARLKNNELARKHYKRYLELNPKAPDAQQVRDILDGK